MINKDAISKKRRGRAALQAVPPMEVSIQRFEIEAAELERLVHRARIRSAVERMQLLINIRRSLDQVRAHPVPPTASAVDQAEDEACLAILHAAVHGLMRRNVEFTRRLELGQQRPPRQPPPAA